MGFSRKFDTVKSGWSIVYIQGLQVKISKKYVSFSEHQFCLGKNSADPDEMLPYAAFHQGLHCFPQYPFRGLQSSTG